MLSESALFFRQEYVGTAVITNILYPIEFSSPCVAMAAYVHGAARLLGAKVSLIHVVDLTSLNGFELYSRPAQQIAEEHRNIAKERLDSFLTAEFPLAECPRILASGEPAAEIARVVREGRFDLIIMPTHDGFRRMLLGSTTAKVLNYADCPVYTSTHADTIAQHPLGHREWLCAIDLRTDSERVLRFAMEAAAQAHGSVSILHAVRGHDPDLPIQLNVDEQTRSVQEALRRSAELQRVIGIKATVRIAIGPVKEALLEATGHSDADVLVIGRSPMTGVYGRMRGLTSAVIRASPVPVLSI
jgi:nucleotide-binding universal stress UspA family protein